MKVAQSCLTLFYPVDCSPPGSSVHGILQAIKMEWVATPFSRGSSQARDRTQISCIAGGFFTVLLCHQGSPYITYYIYCIDIYINTLYILYTSNQFLLFAVVNFYKVTSNTESRNTEPLLSQRRQEVKFLPASGHDIFVSRPVLTLFCVCFYLRTSCLIYVVDSLVTRV